MKYGRRWPLRPLLRGNIEIYDCHTNCSNDNDNKVLFNKMSLSFQTKGQKPASKCSHDFSIIGSNSFPTGVRTWVLNGQKTSCQTLTQLYWQPWIPYSFVPSLWEFPSLNVSLFCVKTVNHTNKNRNQIIYKQIADFSWSKGRHVFVAESFPHHVQLISNDPPVASEEPGGSSRIFHVLTSAYETDTVASYGKTNASAHAARNAERSSNKKERQ